VIALGEFSSLGLIQNESCELGLGESRYWKQCNLLNSVEAQESNNKMNLLRGEAECEPVLLGGIHHRA
jgi:hypothetical protein